MIFYASIETHINIIQYTKYSNTVFKKNEKKIKKIRENQKG